MKTVAIQLPVNKIDCPKSGWSIKKIIIDDNNKKQKRYLICEFCNFSKVKIFTVVKIKKVLKFQLVET